MTGDFWRDFKQAQIERGSSTSAILIHPKTLRRVLGRHEWLQYMNRRPFYRKRPRRMRGK